MINIDIIYIITITHTSNLYTINWFIINTNTVRFIYYCNNNWNVKKKLLHKLLLKNYKKIYLIILTAYFHYTNIIYKNIYSTSNIKYSY